MWFVFALLSAVSAALVAIFGKLGLTKVDSTLATTVRAVIMAVFLVGLSLMLRKFDNFSTHTFSGRRWLFIILAGIAGAVSWLCYFTALRLGLASKVAAIDRLSLIFVVLFSILILGETLRWKTALGALFMVGGAVLMVLT